MSSIAYLNGTYLPLDEVTLSPLDRGFLFGDGVYELIPSYNHHLFRPDQHLQRLLHSLNSIHLESPHTLSDWRQILQTLVKKNQTPHQNIYLQVTRGVDPLRDQRIRPETTPTIFAMTTPMDLPGADYLEQERGIHCITTDDIRWQRCDIKSTSLLANVLLRQQANQDNAQEALMIRHGELTEGAACNVFIVQGNTLQTPPLSQHLLGGITRDLILELAHKHPISVQETTITESQLAQADEIWITSSTLGIRPVVQLNDRPVGNGQPGSLWRTIAQDYADYRLSLMQ